MSEVQGLVQAQDAGHPLAGAHCAPPDKVVRPLEPALWPNNGSRMTRECHVRFCESAGVRSPRATHLVLGCQHEADGKKLLVALKDRLAHFGLSLHEGKTRLIAFGRFAAQRRQAAGLRRPETFDFLGFTHYCGETRSGRFMVKRKTQAKRMVRKLKILREEMARRMHTPIREQHQWLCQVLRGHCQYYGVSSTTGHFALSKTASSGFGERHSANEARRAA